MADFEQHEALWDEFLTVERPLPFFEGQLRIVELPKNSRNVKHAAIRRASTALDTPKLARISAESS